jgi:uncharacterized membrane protein
MNPISKFLVILTSIVGFFVIPVLLVSWLLVFKFEDPAFYIRAVDYSNLVVNFIEDNVRNSSSVPGALKKNIELAKKGVDESIKDHIQPQIQSRLRQTLIWLKGGSKVPSYALELTLFKKDASDSLREALKQQKFTDRVFVSSCLSYLNAMPDVVYLDKPLEKDRLISLVSPWKKHFAKAFQWKKFAPLVPFVFLLLFMIFTLNFQYSFRSFSSLLTFSGGFFLLFFGLILIAVAAAFPFISSLFIKFLRPFNPGLPDFSFIQLVKFMILTVALQGLLASVAMAAVGVLFYAGRRPKKKKTAETETASTIKI